MAIVEFEKALEILKCGEVLGVPTETVYGLAARIDQEAALKKIFTTKKRPFFDPLIVHISTSMNPRDYTSHWPRLYEDLALKFWPGPLTLIAPKNNKISDLITAGLSDVGLRCPDHPLTNQLIEKLHIPLAAPSANLFGKTSPTKAQHVEEEFLGQVPVLEGGDSKVGLESTVVSFDEQRNTLFILRPGFVSRNQLEAICKPYQVRVESGTSKAAPGQLKAHYQPKAPLVISFTENLDLTSSVKERLNQAVRSPTALNWQILKLPQDPTLAARSLYSLLRDHSAPPLAGIWIPLPKAVEKDEGWEMILDRLKRAASAIES